MKNKYQKLMIKIKYEYFKTDFQSWEQYHVLVLYFSSKYLEAYEPVW